MRKIEIENLFQDWVEPDVAHYYLACLLGLMKFNSTQEGWIKVKGVFNTNNPVSSVLFEMLETAVASKMLEKNDDLQYRWNKKFEEHFYWRKYE